MEYCAPEVLQGKDYDGRVADIWSLGIVLFAMATGRLPWISHQNAVVYQQVVNGSFNIPDTLAPALKHLLQRMLAVNPADRITISEILNDPWVGAMTTTKLATMKRDNVRVSASMRAFSASPPPAMSLRPFGAALRANQKSKLIIRPQLRPAATCPDDRHVGFASQIILGGT
jgi:serine/threonine protein kinase